MTIRWAVGVTTVPARRDDLLPQTLTSLAKAGFDRPRLFVDSDQWSDSWGRWRETHSLFPSFSFRSPALGVAANWVLSLHELWMRNPEANRFAMFQDDILACADLR